MKKNLFAILTIFFVSASCNLFSTGSGLLGPIKTIDGGATWQPISTISNSKSSLSGVAVTEMAFSPLSREQIFMSTIDNGIWKSTDSGNSWHQILSKITIYDFYLDQQNPDIIFASGIFNNHGKIIRTTDGGKTWDEMYNEASVSNAVNSLTANPFDSQEVYAVLNSGVIIKSQDSGQTWSVLKVYKEQIFKIRYNRLNNSLYALLRYSGVLKSTDGGANWQNLTQKLTEVPAFSIESFITSSVDQFIKIALDDQSPGVILATTPKGIYKTTNDGASWELLNIPVKSTDLLPRAIASTRAGMLAYTSIGSTIFKTLDGGKSWQTQALPSTAAVNKILIDPVLPQITYAGLLAE